ncbi:hypothetical protein [Flavobacterium ginsenosidimutans]|uniref:Uncharacterized protein n=1 Tax=Flavobacterium ginsenosidimutans TaxID=687844 RepID=A0ABZ2Q865_9FLAO
MKTDTKENDRQDDENFQNTDSGKQGQQKTASPAAHLFTDNAQPDYQDDLSMQEISKYKVYTCLKKAKKSGQN